MKVSGSTSWARPTPTSRSTRLTPNSCTASEIAGPTRWKVAKKAGSCAGARRAATTSLKEKSIRVETSATSAAMANSRRQHRRRLVLGRIGRRGRRRGHRAGPQPQGRPQRRGGDDQRGQHHQQARIQDPAGQPGQQGTGHRAQTATRGQPAIEVLGLRQVQRIGQHQPDLGDGPGREDPGPEKEGVDPRRRAERRPQPRRDHRAHQQRRRRPRPPGPRRKPPHDQGRRRHGQVQPGQPPHRQPGHEQRVPGRLQQRLRGQDAKQGEEGGPHQAAFRIRQGWRSKHSGRVCNRRATKSSRQPARAE